MYSAWQHVHVLRVTFQIRTYGLDLIVSIEGTNAFCVVVEEGESV